MLVISDLIAFSIPWSRARASAMSGDVTLSICRENDSGDGESGRCNTQAIPAFRVDEFQAASVLQKIGVEVIDRVLAQRSWEVALGGPCLDFLERG